MIVRIVRLMLCCLFSWVSISANRELIEHSVEHHVPVVAEAVQEYEDNARKYEQDAQRLTLSATQSIAEQLEELKSEAKRLQKLHMAVKSFQNEIRGIQQLSDQNTGMQLLNDIINYITSTAVQVRWTPPVHTDKEVVKSLKVVFSGGRDPKARIRIEKTFKNDIAAAIKQTNKRLDQLITLLQGEQTCH